MVDTQAICRNKAARLIQESAFLRSKSPTKIFEYMAKGIPVISTKVGEAAAFVEDGHTGILCETSRQLADAFVRLALDADLRQRMGSAAHPAWRSGTTSPPSENNSTRSLPRW